MNSLRFLKRDSRSEGVERKAFGGSGMGSAEIGMGAGLEAAAKEEESDCAGGGA